MFKCERCGAESKDKDEHVNHMSSHALADTISGRGHLKYRVEIMQRNSDGKLFKFVGWVSPSPETEISEQQADALMFNFELEANRTGTVRVHVHASPLVAYK